MLYTFGMLALGLVAAYLKRGTDTKIELHTQSYDKLKTQRKSKVLGFVSW